MKILLLFLLITLPLLSRGQLSKARGYQLVDLEAGWIPQENFGYQVGLGYGRYVRKNVLLRLGLQYETLDHVWRDTDYFVYERKVDLNGVEYLDSVASPRDRPGTYGNLALVFSAEGVILQRSEAFYLSWELQIRGGMEQFRQGASWELTYGGGGGILTEFYLSPQLSLMGRIRYTYQLRSAFTNRLTLGTGLRVSFR